MRAITILTLLLLGACARAPTPAPNTYAACASQVSIVNAWNPVRWMRRKACLEDMQRQPTPVPVSAE